MADYQCEDNERCINNRCVDACEVKHCAPNAYCIAQDHRADCRCITGYVGDGEKECRREWSLRLHAWVECVG